MGVWICYVCEVHLKQAEDFMRTFPELRGAPFGFLLLDALAQEREYNRNASGVLVAHTNPLLDPETCHAMIQEAHARLGMVHSYGGWLEDRRVLWRGSYLERDQHWIHVGVDFMVPAGTRIAATWNAIVEQVDDDTPEVGGWGPRVIVRLKDTPNILLIFAHLGVVFCKKNDSLSPGGIFATVGAPPNNGGWFPHLHVQAIDLDHFDGDWSAVVRSVDGYIHDSLLPNAAKMFPDPMRYVRL